MIIFDLVIQLVASLVHFIARSAGRLLSPDPARRATASGYPVLAALLGLVAILWVLLAVAASIFGPASGSSFSEVGFLLRGIPIFAGSTLVIGAVCYAGVVVLDPDAPPRYRNGGFVVGAVLGLIVAIAYTLWSA